MTKYTDKDIKFLRNCRTYAQEFTTCISPRRVGAFIVRHERQVAEGVNGPPSKLDHVEYRFIRLGNKAVAGIGWFYSEEVNKWVKYADYHINRISATKTVITRTFEDAQHNQYTDLKYYILPEHQRLISFKDEDDTKGEIVSTSTEIMCPRYLLGFQSGEQLDLCGCVHAEENAILCCALNGIESFGTTMYVHGGFPCERCVGSIINAGINKVVCLDDGQPDYSKDSRHNLYEAGIDLVQVPLEVI